MRYKSGISLFDKGSLPCILNTITNMVMITGMAANRVKTPMNTIAAQKNSASMAMVIETVGLKPKTEANRISFPEISF